MLSCYLAGPISGLNYDSAQGWRTQASEQLAPEIICYSPLRAKSWLRQHGVIEGAYPDHPLSNARAILTRDHFDCMRADLIFCNLLDVDRVSIGTVMEIAFAYAYRKPLVMCIRPGSVHDHPMITEATGFTCDNLADGIDLVRTILLP
jgi:nucleoside 2-deoxyribosyltransferase